MKVFRKILYALLCVANVYFAYSWIGYLVLGIKHPTIYGETNTNFMGMYIMSITFFVLFAVLSTILLIWGIKYIKSRKIGKNSSNDLLDDATKSVKKKPENTDEKMLDMGEKDNKSKENSEGKNDAENKQNNEII